MRRMLKAFPRRRSRRSLPHAPRHRRPRSPKGRTRSERARRPARRRPIPQTCTEETPMSALELRRLSVRSSVSLATGALSAACLAFNGRVATEPDEPLDASGDLGDESPAYTPDPGVRCGAATWCPPDTVCCTKRGESGWFTQAPPCGGPGTCGFFASFACDDPWDCGDGGQAHAYSCCASRSDNANA